MLNDNELIAVEKMQVLLTEINCMLDEMGLIIPEIIKVHNILNSKNISDFNSIKRTLYSGFRRLDEIGVDNEILNELSSQVYILAKNNELFYLKNK